ncbi:hypothetical protein [Streptomyces sp. NPDC005435]|uniref:hypothetical protein n=1 Tax=Streptomyces sp. NPDC005435 TaxID=3154464 RepID=UPI003453BF44
MSRSDTPRLLELLRQNPRAAELAAFPFDFDLGRAEHGEEVRLASGAPLTGIAGDDTGGTYFLSGADGGVLYADSDGRAGLIAESVADALELVAGLPGWRDHVRLSPGTAADEVIAAVGAAEADIRASYAPELDAGRGELLAALGLTPPPPAELFARMHRALRRTEPDHVLLLADEGCAHELLDPHPRLSPAETVLAVCRAALDRLRANRGAWREVAFAPVAGARGSGEHDAHAGRRAGVLHAARYDRRAAHLPLLRHLLEQETLCRGRAALGGMGEELHLAVFLVARLRAEEDLHRLYAARCANFDTWCALSDLPLGLSGKGRGEEPRWEPEALEKWVAALDTPEWFGDDPGHEPIETWIALGRRQGHTELARTALIRALDDIGPADTAELPWITDEFTALGDFRQAARAQRLYTRLQDTDPGRRTAYVRLAALERQSGDLDEAGASLRRALATVDSPPGQDQPTLFDVETTPEDQSPDWSDTGVGLDVTEEHLRLAHAAADAGLPALAHRSLTTGTTLLNTLHRPPPTLFHVAQGASLACGDTDSAARCAALGSREEQRIAEFPYALDDDDDQPLLCGRSSHRSRGWCMTGPVMAASPTAEPTHPSRRTTRSN